MSRLPELPISSITAPVSFLTDFCSCKTCILYIPVNKALFKSQALLDEKAIVAAMAYVDLNPVRAQLATMHKDSVFSSNKTRIEHLKTNTADSFLAPFARVEIEAVTTGVLIHSESKCGSQLDFEDLTNILRLCDRL